MSLFDKEAAKELLIEYIDREPEIKERYYATSLLNLIDWQSPPRYSTVKYENQNIDGLYELKENYSVSINSLVNIAIRNAVTEEKMDTKGLDKLK